ncbi:mycothiol transferase [Nocardiopsis quinghaiensis]|uniref:mycothiol transferase n=1 Tax=Nocardiopsis quinghaiensis TaxID=464995 RepID=UPI00123BB548|nr:DUF664 domain-containing protein [Nocardiopsis quinghaiensis]
MAPSARAVVDRISLTRPERAGHYSQPPSRPGSAGDHSVGGLSQAWRTPGPCAGSRRTALHEAGRTLGTSLHGLVRHPAGVERWRLRVQFAGEELPLPYYSDGPDQDFDGLEGDPAEDFAVRHGDVVRAREAAASSSPDGAGTEARSGEPIQLRVVLVKPTAEAGPTPRRPAVDA